VVVLRSRWRPLVADAGVAVGVLAVSLALSAGAARGQPGTRALDPVAYLVTVLASAVLVMQRRHPVTTAAVVGAALLVFAVRDYPGGPLAVPVAVALYSVGVGVRRRRAMIVGAVALLLVTARSVTAVAGHGTVSAFSWAVPGWVVACLVWGVAVRARRQATAALRQRAEAAEATREAEARRRVAEERLRIARELHDVVGHSFAAVNVQARAAGTLLDADPVGARAALDAIATTSRDALREIRATLSVLRESTDAGLARLDSALDPLRAAGIRVETTVDVPAGSLPAVVDAAVYRVVQEATTNVLRHAGATTVAVTVSRHGGEVHIEVVDDGAAGSTARQPVHGRGIAGMRERAVGLGGQVDAGPAGEGGWRVVARIPVSGSPS